MTAKTSPVAYVCDEHRDVLATSSLGTPIQFHDVDTGTLQPCVASYIGCLKTATYKFEFSYEDILYGGASMTTDVQHNCDYTSTCCGVEHAEYTDLTRSNNVMTGYCGACGEGASFECADCDDE